MLELPSPALIGVVHLPALPGSVLHQGSMDEIIERALADARALRAAGFDAAMIENFGDVPFSASAVSPATVAAMAVVADHVRRETTLPMGINCLRNDARSAMGIAAAVKAGFVRVNVHVGVSATDQGILMGAAHETLAFRKQLGWRIAILADVHVKHAVSLNAPDLAQAARDTAYRGLADGLIVTGAATGRPVDVQDLITVSAAVPDRRTFVGSGATVENVAALLQHAGGIIVGTGIKTGGITANPVDASLAKAFVRAAKRG
jgi:hypothetical protein